MRVSTHQSVEQAIARLQSQSTLIAHYQLQISSGMRVQRPSHDPAAFVEIRSGHTDVERLATYAANIGHAETTLNNSVATLLDVEDILVQAERIASEGANASTDDAAYDALANETDGLINRLFSVLNTRIDGRYLFSGTATNTQPFIVTAQDASGRPLQFGYRGSIERVRTIVGPEQTVDTVYAGEQVFQQPGLDIFQALMGLRDDLRNTSLDLSARAVAVGQRLGNLQQVSHSIRLTIGEQSATLETLQAMSSRYGELKLSRQQRTSELESADIAEAMVRLGEQQNLFQATLGVTARLFDVSLLDFLQ